MEKGLVVDIKENKMTLRFASQDACQKCGGCMTKGDHSLMIDVPNTVDAKIGDSVLIENDSSTVLKAASIIYLLPVLALLLGYFAGLAFAQILGISEGFAVVTSLLALVASFPLISFIDKKMEKNASFNPVIVKKL